MSKYRFYERSPPWLASTDYLSLPTTRRRRGVVAATRAHTLTVVSSSHTGAYTAKKENKSTLTT